MKQRRHVNNRRFRLIGKTRDDVQDVISDRLTGVNRNRMADDRSFVARDRCMGQRADHQPGQEPNSIDTIDEIFRSEINAKTKSNRSGKGRSNHRPLLNGGGRIVQPWKETHDRFRISLTSFGEFQGEILSETGFQLSTQRVLRQIRHLLLFTLLFHCAL